MLNRRQFLATLSETVAAYSPARRPNIIFLLLDDLGWKDLGCYKHTFHETPNLDKLASQGVQFTNAYAACPVCSPTRAAIMTGKYPARLHLTDWIPGSPAPRGAKLLTPKFEQQLPLQEMTIAERLKLLDYRTASIGKWHLGGEGFGPEAQGFDLNVSGNFRGSPASYFGPFDLPNLKGGTKDDYLTEKLTEAAENFISEAAGKVPFFLYLPEYAVHTPIQAKAAAIWKYRDKNGGRDFPHPVYAAMVESVDIALGRIRAKLDQLNIAGNTILIVTSDNGGLRHAGKDKVAITDNSPLRAGKGHVYEGGIREPLLVYWPGVTGAGAAVDFPVSSIDYVPTILEMAGGKVPGSDEIDGVTFAPLLRGGPAPKRNTLYWHYPHYSPQGGVPAGAVRKGDWKLIEFYEDSRLELFNVKEDIGERRNLVRREKAKADELHRLLKRWRSDTGAAMPSPNPAYDPARAEAWGASPEPPTPALEPVS